VASLAEEVGLSRSVFAARFTQLVGEPPLGGVPPSNTTDASPVGH